MAINICITLSAITIFILILQVSSDASIRIPAYEPKPPEYVPGRILARRVSGNPGIIQDPPYRRHPTNRTPFHPPSLQNNPHRRNDDSPSANLSEILRSSLSLLSPDALKNPNKATSQDIPRPEAGIFGPPVGPPAIPVNVIGPPAIPDRPIRPPALPELPIGPPPPPPGFPPGIGPPSIGPGFLSTVGPPTLPTQFLTPAPPSSSGLEVTRIKCMEIGGTQSFQALIKLPDGYHSVPVLEDRPIIDLTRNPTCRVIPRSEKGTEYSLVLSKYDDCGVRQCRQSNGETWKCLILRFPLLNGLKLPEDEIVEIRCRPHDATTDHNAILAVATAKYADKNMIISDKPPTVFEGSQEFKCEIGLFRQLPGTQEFTSRVDGDVSLELGEKVQLWSIVKAGDGWHYSRLTEIVIIKEDESLERSSFNTLVMVYSDGCRNPSYKVIAQNHPMRDRRNPLINKFTFRVFMFQDMQPGDRLLISAKVIGCIREEDCAPVICSDDGAEGYGRKKRQVSEQTITATYTVPTPKPPYPPESSTPPELTSTFVRRTNQVDPSNTTNWSRNLAIRVKMPGDTLQNHSVKFEDCKLYLYISLGIGALFCIVCSACAAVAAIQLKRNDPKKGSEMVHIKTVHREQPKTKRPLQPQVSSSGSESLFTETSETSSGSNHLRELPVPPTVKNRKKRVNAELMNLFNNEDIIPYNTPYPPMLNYYGYMVVPRPPPNQKKSVRSVKRARASDLYNKSLRKMHVESDEDFRDSESRSSTEMSNHTSIIQITSSGSDTVKTSGPPKPKPRSQLHENIYHEIRQNTVPTMV